MNSIHTRYSCVLALVIFFSVLSGRLSAQGNELGAIQGTVTDKSGAVVPGVTVSVKNQATGFERVVISEDNGLYRVPGLQPGLYAVSAELSGFSPFAAQNNVVNVGRTTTVSVVLEPAGSVEKVVVVGSTPLVETAHSEIGGVVENREVTNLPLNGRNFSSLATLIPGARPVGAWDPTKTRIGAVSIAGAGGRNINTTIDGVDNKDNTVGGYVQNVSLEAVQEFSLKTQRFSAADGRSQGGLLSIVTKSGANDFHGSFFSFFRDKSLNANDYFSNKAGSGKADFSREQFGGSIGGPIARNKAFFFFTFERLQEDQFAIIEESKVKELQALKTSGISIYGATPNPASQIPQPFTNDLTTARIDYSFNDRNNAYLSWSENRDNTLNDQGAEDLTTSNFNRNKNELFSVVWNSVISPRLLNQFVFGHSYWNNLIDSDNYSPVSVQFASVGFGTNVNVPQQSLQKKWQFKDAVTWTRGAHGLKFGVDYVFQPLLGGFFKFDPVPFVSFFDNPTTILTNKTLYPQGFATPGIVQGITATAGDPDFSLKDNAHMFAAYFQDDWKVTPNFTLNLGVRYDLDVKLVGGATQDKNRTYLILKKIDSPISNGWVNGLPKDDTNNFAPRLGFVYDPTGQAKTVIRGGYGIYYDQVFLNIPLFAIQQANANIFATVVSLSNSAIGRGDLATFKVGNPLPPIPAGPTDVPNGSLGRIIDPTYISPMSQQSSVGFSRQLTREMVLEIDYTHVLNTHESRRMRLNPRIPGGTRRVLADAFVKAGLPAGRLADIIGETSTNRSWYDGLNIQVRKQLSHGVTFQTSYVLSKGQGYAGRTGEFGATATFNQFNVLDPRELAPTVRDERHRFVWSGVIDLPWGVQLSPIVQIASARPYNLTAGRDLNGDGIANDLCVGGTPAPNGRICPEENRINGMRGGFDLDGKKVSGKFFLMDLRVSKYVDLSKIREGMRIGVFFESFNLTNRTNFGNRFIGNVRSGSFMKAAGLPTGTYGIAIAAPYQAQIGFRFSF